VRPHEGQSVAFEWRPGPRRAFVAAVVYALVVCGVVAYALRWPIAWSMLPVVATSAALDAWRFARERRLHRLVCTPFGVTIDDIEYDVRDAWLALGWTVLWLDRVSGGRRLLYVHRSELTTAQFAALRRRVKSLDYR